MRRADRLFQIIEILRKKKVVTAAYMAQKLEVSMRTIYRDIADLLVSGVPIEGEAGVGYALSRGFDLPPIMFTEDEIESLVLGARTIKSYGDPALAQAADGVLAKVEAVLPPRLKKRVSDSTLFALNFRPDRQTTEDTLSILRPAIRQRQKIVMSYKDAKDDDSTRTIRPLCLVFAPPIWMISGWCELRKDFRTFRIDRIKTLRTSGETFVEEPGKSLTNFLSKVERDNTKVQ